MVKMFLHNKVLPDGCSVRYVAHAQTRCSADHKGGKPLETKKHFPDFVSTWNFIIPYWGTLCIYFEYCKHMLLFVPSLLSSTWTKWDFRVTQLLLIYQQLSHPGHLDVIFIYSGHSPVLFQQEELNKWASSRVSQAGVWHWKIGRCWE